MLNHDKQWVKASQSKICCNALNNPTRLSTALTSNAKENNGHSEEFRKEFTELTGTQFECIDNNGELFVANA